MINLYLDLNSAGTLPRAQGARFSSGFWNEGFEPPNGWDPMAMSELLHMLLWKFYSFVNGVQERLGFNSSVAAKQLFGQLRVKFKLTSYSDFFLSYMLYRFRIKCFKVMGT